MNWTCLVCTRPMRQTCIVLRFQSNNSSSTLVSGGCRSAQVPMLSLGVSSDALDSSPNMSYSEGCKVRFETMIFT
jgi:hypothetical protein